MDIQKIASNFLVPGTYLSANPIGSGHINETYITSFNNNGVVVRYILRKINKFVFNNPKVVIKNSVNISAHIRQKLINQGVTDVERRTMTFFVTHENKYYHKDQNGDYWCMILFFEDAYTIDFVQTKEQSYKSAKAFGNFQRLIIDANVSDYQETIPDFHNLPKRIEAFDIAVEKNPINRLQNINNELIAINNNRVLGREYTGLMSKNLPVRLTHNDTKINNVMLDKKTDEGLCVIDLDTVMPGTILNDFGDMVRTSTCTVAEDEKNISKVHIQLDIFEAMTKGYLEPLTGIISKLEIRNLVFGAKLIVFEQAIRFLTDYLLGDKYYSTLYNDHNLVRAQNQFALLKSIQRNEAGMKEIVKKYA
ncbi:MAG: phosphotransferase [Bacteroidota bacterium]